MQAPTLRQLEYFVTVASKGSFQAAAKACGVSQPGLSGQLQQLESSLDVQLFERNRRRVQLTAEGEVLLPRARAVLTEAHVLVEAAATLKGPLGGRLRLGVIPTIAPYLLPRVLPRVQRHYTELRIELVEARTGELLELLRGGELDLLLLALEADLGSVATAPLFGDDFSAVLPRSHRLAARKTLREEELRQETVLLLDDGHCLRDQVWSVCEGTGAVEADDFRASSLGTVCQMVAAGSGVTLVPSLALKAEAKSARLSVVPFQKPRPHRTIGLAWRPSSPRGAEYQVLGDLIRRYGSAP